MILSQRQLILIGCILDDNSLHAAGLAHSEDVRGFGKVEGHDTVAHVVNMLLFGLGDGNHTAKKQKEGQRSTKSVCLTRMPEHIARHSHTTSAEMRLRPWNRNQADAATTGAELPANSSNACTAFAAYISEGPPPI